MRLLISCDRSGTVIPESYKFAFDIKQEREQIESKESLQKLAKHFAHKLEAKFFVNRISPQLIDCDRSLNDEMLFSAHSNRFAGSVKKYLIEKYYLPYRLLIKDYIHKPGKTVHLSFRSYSTVKDNMERSVDIGLIADYNRTSEYKLAKEWKEWIYEENSELLVLVNLPYEDSDRGFMAELKKSYNEGKYLGIELKIKESLLREKSISKLEDVLKRSFISTCYAMENS